MKISTPLDCVVRPELCGGLAELAKGLWLRKACPERSRRDDLDADRLAAYVRRLDHKATARRIGFLLETLRAEPQGEAYGLGGPETIAALQSFTNHRYALLDPTLLDEGPYRARWRLRINFDKLWASRLAVQVPGLPHLNEVLRVVRRHLRGLGLA